MHVNRYYPSYVQTAYDMWLFDNVISSSLIHTWKNLRDRRNDLRAASLFHRSERIWKELGPAYASLKQAYVNAGGMVS